MEPVNPDIGPQREDGREDASHASPVGMPGADLPTTAAPKRLWAAAVAAGIAAGLAAWGIGELALIGFKPGFQMSDELRQRIETSTAEVRRQMDVSTTRTAAVSYGALAAAMGLALGLAGGIASRSRSRAATAGALGLVLGGVVGAAATFGLTLIFHEWFRASPDSFSKDLRWPLLLHAGMWLPAGLFGGLALGLGFEGWRRGFQAAFGGALGAVCAVALYEIVGAILFPTARTTHPIATSTGARLLAHASVALLATIVAVWSARNVPRPNGRTGIS